MRYIKKICAAFLACALVFSICMPEVFASGETIYLNPSAGTGNAGTLENPVGLFSEAKSKLNNGDNIEIIGKEAIQPTDTENVFDLTDYPESKLVVTDNYTGPDNWYTSMFHSDEGPTLTFKNITLENQMTKESTVSSMFPFSAIFLYNADLTLQENTTIINKMGYGVDITTNDTSIYLTIGSKVKFETGKANISSSGGGKNINIYITSPLTDDITTENILSGWYEDNYQWTKVYGDPDTGYKLTESDAEKIKDVNGEYYCTLNSEKNSLDVAKTKSITEDSVVTSEIVDQHWTGSAIEPELTIKDGDDELTKGKDYEVTFTDNTAVGTATVKVTGKNKYTGSFEKKFNIVQGSIADASVTGIASKTYTGKAITQKPVVKLSDNTLTEGTDYTVSYKNNVKVGTATMTITGKGNCAGTITKTFKIKKASNTLSVKAKKTATVKYSKVKKKSQGLKVSSVLSVKNAKGKLSYYKYTSSKTKKISISKSGKITVKKGIKKGTYKVKVKVKAAGDSNYYSKTKTAYFKIKVK